MRPTEHESSTTAASRTPAEFIWAVYITLLAVLASTEAWIKPEIRVDPILDASILLVAFLGGIAAWALSARFVLKSARGHDHSLLWMRIGAGWFLGPIIAFAVVLGINGILGGDIDGGLLLFYLPLLGVLLPIFVLPAVIFIWSRARD